MDAGFAVATVIERLPSALLEPGPRGIPWWQWVFLPVLFVTAGLLGSLASRLLRAALGPIARRTSVDWDDAVLTRMHGPVAVALALGLVKVLAPLTGLSPPAAHLADSLVRAVFLANLFWALSRVIDVGTLVVQRSHSTASSDRAGMPALVRLVGRIAKILVLALAVIAFLSELGYPVASLIAGLGIGGLAFALAAQKTVENLFGALSLGADQPFKEGDFVRIEDFVGTVERIGMRSTRIRTLDRTVITLPNGKVADMRLESFSARDRIRLFCTLGLVYETTEEQMRKILAEVEQVLRSHPRIWPDAVVVRFVGFGPSSLDVEVMCWFQTADWNEFQGFRQDVLLSFMGIVERAGSAFAFPTQTVHVAGAGAREGEGERAAS